MNVFNIVWEALLTVHRVLQERSSDSREAEMVTAPNPQPAAKGVANRSHRQYEDKGVQTKAETGESGVKRKRISVVVSVVMEAEGGPLRKHKTRCTFDAY